MSGKGKVCVEYFRYGRWRMEGVSNGRGASVEEYWCTRTAEVGRRDGIEGALIAMRWKRYVDTEGRRGLTEPETAMPSTEVALLRRCGNDRGKPSNTVPRASLCGSGGGCPPLSSLSGTRDMFSSQRYSFRCFLKSKEIFSHLACSITL